MTTDDFRFSDRAEKLWDTATSAAEAGSPDEELAALLQKARAFTLDHLSALLEEQERSGIDFGWQELLNDSESLAKFRHDWGV